MSLDIERVSDGADTGPSMTETARPTAPNANGAPEPGMSRRGAAARSATAARASDEAALARHRRLQEQIEARVRAMPRRGPDAAQSPLGKAGASQSPATGKPATGRPATLAQRSLRAALLAASLVVTAAVWWFWGGDISNSVETTMLPATASDDLAQVKQALQQEHRRAEEQSRELAITWRELRSQAVALADKAAQDSELTDLRQTMDRKVAQYEELLAQERERNQVLEEQLAVGSDRGRSAAASSTLVTESPPRDGTPALPAVDKPSTTATPDASSNPDLARLMARASLLLDQGDVGAARQVLEHAAETGNASALFALAQTYDPDVLAAWRAFGTQGDVGKARELYAKALDGGAHEAGDRLNALRH
jgi:hypothetical protein